MIRKRGKNSWEIRVERGRDPTTGKRRQRTFTVRGTRRDAEKAERAARHEVDTGIDLDPARLTVAQYLERWLNDYAPLTAAPTTLRRYGQLCRRISSIVGHLPLQGLRPAHVQSMCTQLTNSGSSPRTVEQHYGLLKQALKRAVLLQLVPRNVAEAATPPRPEPKPLRILTTAEVRQVVEACPDPTLSTLVAIAAATGARQGELLALRWQDIDLDQGRASIVRTLEYRPGVGPVFKEPKTKRARRSVALSDPTVRALKLHRSRQLEHRLQGGGAYQDQDLVFASRVGSPLDGRNVTKRFQKATQEAGLTRCRFHDLRHTAATEMLRAGVNPKVVSERLGHAKVSFTLDTYSHVQPDMQEAAAGVLDAVFAADAPQS